MKSWCHRTDYHAIMLVVMTTTITFLSQFAPQYTIIGGIPAEIWFTGRERRRSYKE